MYTVAAGLPHSPHLKGTVSNLGAVRLAAPVEAWTRKKTQPCQTVAKNQKETSQRTVCPLPACLSLLHSVFPLWPVTRPHRDKDDLTRPCKHTRHRLLNYRAALLLGPPWCNERALQLSISGYLTLQTGPPSRMPVSLSPPIPAMTGVL